MTSKTIHQRWVPLPWGVYGTILAIIFGGIGVYSLLHPEDEPTVRMAIPLYVVSCYWVVACLFNIRSTFVTARGVWNVVWPLPVVLPYRSARRNIQHCYLHEMEMLDEATEGEHYFAVGLQTVAGRKIDISRFIRSKGEARHLATEIAGVLNAALHDGRLIEVVQTDQLPDRGRKIRIVLLGLFWLAICIVSIFIGAAWEEKHRLEIRL